MKKSKIKIATRCGFMESPGYETDSGLLAVHKNNNGDGTWTVTHVPSGKKITWGYKTKKKVCQICDAIESLGIDLSPIDLKNNISEGDKVRLVKVIKKVGNEF